MTATEDWQAITGDAAGRLYGVVADKSQGRSHILVVDVTPEALQGSEAQEASTVLNNLHVSQVVSTTPAIDFVVTAASASPNGHQLLLLGTSQQDDAPVPVLALVDLYGSEPLAAAATAAAGLRPAASSSSGSSAAAAAAAAGRYPSAKQRVARLVFVHWELFRERPGMKILQASWHPSSSSHFAVLSSDNRWRLYHTAQLEEAEQTFWIKLPGSQASIGLLHRQRGAPTPPRATAFAFGPPSLLGWSSMSVLFLSSDGGVYCLCPVVPFGLRAAAAMLRRMMEASTGTAHAWLLAAFLPLLSSKASAISARPHVLETQAPALQGPLNLRAASLKPSSTHRVACTLAVSSSGSSGSSEGDGGGGARFSALLTGFSNGSVYAHALELEQIVPCWQDATPQVAYGDQGDVSAVRYEVEATPVQPATGATGLGAVPEEGDAAEAAAAAAAAGLVSPLLLLDALKINLHSQAGSSAAASQGLAAAGFSSSRASPTDSDEESDAGYDPTAPPQQGLAGDSLNPSSRRGFGFSRNDNESDEEGEEEEEEEDEQLQQLRKVTLHAAPELPGRFWACHDQGCWGINIKWLQQINSDSSSGNGGWWQQQQQQQLPSPVLQELLVSGPGVLSSCVVGNALLGSGCVVLEKGLRPQGLGPQLTFLRPRPAGVLGEGVLGRQGAAAAGEGEGEDGLIGLTGLHLTPDELDTKSRMEDFYSDIKRGPRRLPPPNKPDNLAALSPADPTGLQYFHDATNWLSQTHVQYAAGATADLVKRVNQLHEEVVDQSSALSSLVSLAEAAVKRQAALQAQLDRLGTAAAALAERGQVLASLHWSLPRPLSKAETHLDKQLQVWEKRYEETQQSWKALRNRLDVISKQQQQQTAGTTAAAAAAAPRQAGSSSSSFLGVPSLAAARAASRPQVTSTPGGPLAAAQLERVKQLLVAQHSTIACDTAELDELNSQLEAWRVEHPEVDLPARLAQMGVV